MATSKIKLMLPSTMARAGWEILEAREGVEVVPFQVGAPIDEFHQLLRDVDGAALSLTRFGEKELEIASRIRVVARVGVGYDAVDVAALTRRKIPLMVTGIANSVSVAEQALFFMLTLAKLGARMNTLLPQGRWSERMAELPADLFGKTLLLIGFGRIGTRLARRCLAMEMAVQIYDPYVAPDVIRAAGCVPVSDLDAAVPEADFISIHCPKTDASSGMFGAARLGTMKPTAYLVNTARGGIIDETALHEALVRGALAGAALDVFDPEPPALDHPLLRLPNVVTAPHMAGVTKESVDRMAITAARNLLDALDGKPDPAHVVNKEVLAHR